MNRDRSLPRLLKVLVILEIAAWVAGLMLPEGFMAEAEHTTFGHFWRGLWYLLAILWIIGWVAILTNWRKGFEIYASGWIAAFAYTLLDGPAVSSALGNVCEHLSTLAGGAVLALAWLRKVGIGNWTEPVAIKRLSPREAVR